MKRIIFVVGMILLCSQMAKVSFCQETIEFLGLQKNHVTSLSINYGVIAVGTDRNGVYWQTEYLPSDTGWIHIGLDSQSVQTVYAHKSGPIGWAISVGVTPDTVDSAFIYCSFMGGGFVPNSVGILDSLTDKISDLDGFPDPTICGETYAAGGKALYRRKFTASSWTPVYTTSIEGYIQTVKVKEQYPGVVLVGGAEGFSGFLLIKSTDFGNNWVDISPPGTVRNIDFAGDSTDIIFTATYQKIYRSTDGGSNWESVFDGQGLYQLTEVLYDPLTMSVYAAGGDGLDTGSSILFLSNDNGDNWQRFPLQMSGPVIDMEFGRNGWIYFATTNSGVFRIQQQVVNVEEKTDASPPTAFQLFQNYPNPFNPATTIEYEVVKAGYVQLTIYNPLGQLVRTLVDEWQPAGGYRVSWDGTGEQGFRVTSGLYFYELKVGDLRLRRKMVLLR